MKHEPEASRVGPSVPRDAECFTGVILHSSFPGLYFRFRETEETHER